MSHRVAAKKVVSAFDYAVGQVVEIDRAPRLVDRQVLDEQIAAVADAVLRRPGLAGNVVNPVAEPVPTRWTPAALAAKHVFKT